MVDESKVDLCGKIKHHYGLVATDFSRFVDKDKMKNYLKNYGVRVPKHMVLSLQRFASDGWVYIEEIHNKVPLPGFIKPLNFFGAINTAKIETKNDLYNWFDSNPSEKFTYEIEEFIDGTLYISDSIVVGGKVKYNQICEYSTPCADVHSGKNLGWTTLDRNDPTAEGLQEMTASSNAPNIVQAYRFKKDGDAVRPPRESYDRIAAFIAVAEDSNTALFSAKNATERCHAVIDPAGKVESKIILDFV